MSPWLAVSKWSRCTLLNGIAPENPELVGRLSLSITGMAGLNYNHGIPTSIRIEYNDTGLFPL